MHCKGLGEQTNKLSFKKQNKKTPSNISSMLAQFLLIQHTILCTHQPSHKSTWPFYSPSLGVMKAKRRKLSLLSHCHRAFIFLLSTILQGKPLVFDRHRATPGEATIKAGPPQVLCLSQPALTTIHAHKMKTLVPSAQRPVRTGLMRQFQFFVMSTAGDRTATFTGCGVRAKKSTDGAVPAQRQPGHPRSKLLELGGWHRASPWPCRTCTQLKPPAGAKPTLQSLCDTSVPRSAPHRTADTVTRFLHHPLADGQLTGTRKVRGILLQKRLTEKGSS